MFVVATAAVDVENQQHYLDHHDQGVDVYMYKYLNRQSVQWANLSKGGFHVKYPCNILLSKIRHKDFLRPSFIRSFVLRLFVTLRGPPQY